MASTRIKLDKAIEWHGELYSEIEFREPRYEDYMELGEPFILQPTAGGLAYYQDHEPTINEYAKRCIVSPNSGLFLTQCTLGDARRIKTWLRGLFKDDAVKTEDITTS